MKTAVHWALLITLVLVGCQTVPAFAQTDEAKPIDASAAKDLPAGHSQHGEAFNQGPRQQAYLMGGTGKIRFPVTSKVKDVQKFVEQGIGQVHGFWYFEAERSFRQAAKLDPKCAIAYWGMALANANNSKRAKQFVAEALKRKAGASPREAMYIDALNAYLNEGNRNKKYKQYTAALDKLIKQFPDDIEAKAQRCFMMYKSRGTLKLKYEDVDKAIKDLLAIEPAHPVHHYRIHLWDYKSRQTCWTRQQRVVKRHRPSRTCGTCRGTSIRGSNATTTRCTTKRLRPESIMRT